MTTTLESFFLQRKNAFIYLLTAALILWLFPGVMKPVWWVLVIVATALVVAQENGFGRKLSGLLMTVTAVIAIATMVVGIDLLSAELYINELESIEVPLRLQWIIHDGEFRPPFYVPYRPPA